MARGTEEKQIVINKIKEVFPNAFEHEKVIRIPVGDLQIKVSLTCAKDIVAEPDGNTSKEIRATKVSIAEGEEPVFEPVKLSEPTQEELSNVSALLESLNF